MNMLKLTDSNTIFNNLDINWEQLSVDEFLKEINSSYRTIQLEKGIVLYIVDDFGIRFWVLNNKISQAQLLIKKQETNLENDKFPKNEYNGSIVINEEKVKAPLINFLRNNEDIPIEKDTDSLQYGLNIYFVYLGDRKCTLWVDKNDEEVISLYF